MLRNKSLISSRLHFFGQNSGIHGLKYTFKKETSIYARSFWLLVLVASSGCLYFFLQNARNLGTGVNFTPDTLYLSWSTTFPAVTVREAHNVKVAQKKLAERFPDLVLRLSYDYRRYMADILFGVGSCSRSTCVPCGDAVPCDVPWREIVDNIHKKCDELITECSFNDVQFECCDKFRIVDSEYGSGYSFNTLQHKKPNERNLYAVNKNTGPGVLKFLLLSNAQVSIHSPEELATKFLDSKFKVDVKVNYQNRANVLLSVVEVQNDLLLKIENIDVRGCRYLDEIPEGQMHTYPVYSHGACRLAIDSEKSFKHCGCVHPVRDLSYKHLFCNYTGLNCLAMYEAEKAKLGVDKRKSFDTCLPSCVESELTILHTSMRMVPNDPSKGSLVEIRMAALPALRYQKNILRTNLDLIVTVGGMLGLFFGASILSLVETLYLIIRTPNK